jgi:hypothetical protein
LLLGVVAALLFSTENGVLDIAVKNLGSSLDRTLVSSVVVAVGVVGSSSSSSNLSGASYSNAGSCLLAACALAEGVPEPENTPLVVCEGASLEKTPGKVSGAEPPALAASTAAGGGALFLDETGTGTADEAAGAAAKVPLGFGAAGACGPERETPEESGMKESGPPNEGAVAVVTPEVCPKKWRVGSKEYCVDAGTFTAGRAGVSALDEAVEAAVI